MEVSISDTGIGMDKEITEMIFDPFFTTKAKGAGTGLGLAMVYGFVQRSHGHLTVYSEMGVGTSFKMYLPRSISIVRQTEKPSEVDVSLPKGTETILIVDDEMALATLAKIILDDLGYTTICTHSGHEAQQVLENNTTIDLVFSDVVMPGGMSGLDLADVMAEKYPTVKILLTSGFTGKTNPTERAVESMPNMLRKPYMPTELAKQVRETLDEIR